MPLRSHVEARNQADVWREGFVVDELVLAEIFENLNACAAFY
jgi:hypothetical protein